LTLLWRIVPCRVNAQQVTIQRRKRQTLEYKIMAKFESNFGNTAAPSAPMSAPDQPDIHGAFGDSAPGTPVPNLGNTPIPAPIDVPPAVSGTEPIAPEQTPTQVIDSTFDIVHWRGAERDPAYAHDDYTFEQDYLPAYQFGHSERIKNPPPAEFEALTDNLEARWDEFKRDSRLSWQQAKVAFKQAWDYVTE
jgi:hypothetical protein